MHPEAARPLQRWKPPRGRVLVLAPHPDDETIGCGGTLLLHRRQGDDVKIVFLTDGAAGDPKRYYRGRDYRALRRAEARRAAKVLGVNELEFWGYPDGSLSAAMGVRARLRDLLAAERPAVVYRPSERDPHPDHRALALHFKHAARGPRRRFADCSYEIAFLQKAAAAVDISGVFPKKLEALRRYRSQLRYRDYAAIVAAAGVCRGLLLPRSQYAEAFRITP